MELRTLWVSHTRCSKSANTTKMSILSLFNSFIFKNSARVSLSLFFQNFRWFFIAISQGIFSTFNCFRTMAKMLGSVFKKKSLENSGNWFDFPIPIGRTLVHTPLLNWLRTMWGLLDGKIVVGLKRTECDTNWSGQQALVNWMCAARRFR